MNRQSQRRRKCRYCKTFFVPEARNAHHQKYCGQPDCRLASKRASQRRWTHQSTGRDYFRGAIHVRRVQAWRQAHPGYWKNASPVSASSQTAAPQALNPEQRSCNVPPAPSRTLQDFRLTQEPAFVGLISMVTGSTLQEDIAATTRQVLLRGQHILGGPSPGRVPTQTQA